MSSDISDINQLQNSKQALQQEIEYLRQQLIEHEAASQARIKQLDSLSSALQESEKRYDSLFSQLPRGLQEEDYSSVKRVIDKLQVEGVEDLKQYFLNNKELLRELIVSIEMTNVNQALLQIYREDSLESFLEGEDNIDAWWNDKWAEYYAAEFSALAGPDRIYEDERIDFRIDGSTFETKLITTIIGGSEQNWERVITIFEDVTFRNRDRAALIDAKIAAEEANRAKTEFLSSMSHELRTPLNAILGFSQLFEYDPSLGKQRQSNARAIHNAGQHLLTLIDEILDLSRIEAGRIDFSIESVPLEAVIKDSLTWVADMADSRGISIDFNAEVFRGMLVEADTIRLKQVFLNLITNAVKYNHENGSVSIAGSRCENDCIRISITDTGPGIASDRLSDLFKPFNRLGAEFSGVEGTGIGLVITRQLVNLMGGELEVESSPGIGSTFTVQLKTSNSQITDNTQSTVNFDLAPVAEFPESEIKPHLLIAEDNQVNQDLMDAQLKLLGYSADYADNGVEALKLWKTGNYQLLLTDIRMPKMDGYELIRQIRAMNSVAAASPIIAVTANALESDVKQCMDTGASDFISKPFGLDDLRQILQKWSTQLEGTGAVTATPLQSPKITPDEAIDLSVLKLMVGDNIELHHKLLTTYIVTLPEALDDIQQAFDARNHDLLGEYAHKLKSSSGSLGVTRIANICRLLELACSEGRESEINQLVPELALAAEAVFVFVRAFCN